MKKRTEKSATDERRQTRTTTDRMMGLRMIFTGLTIVLVFFARGGWCDILFKDDFETNTIANREIYDTLGTPMAADAGSLKFLYSITHASSATGLECTLPIAPDAPDEREIEMNFLGGGSDMSNSLFICYACGPGAGMSLPVMPAGNLPNSRTGYIIRFIRHGDATNEVKFYRNDSGTAVELANETGLPSNPIKTLRKVVIVHQKSGEHMIRAEFDTGIRLARSFEFSDSTYPPNNIQRGLELIAKGHVSTSLLAELRTDTWIVSDRWLPAGEPLQK